MRTYTVAIDAHPEGFRKLTVDVEDGEFPVSSLETVELAGAPLVRIGE